MTELPPFRRNPPTHGVAASRRRRKRLSGRARIVAGALGLFFGFAGAQPASAQYFSPHDGFRADGKPKFVFDGLGFAYLPNTTARIGLDRAAGQDIIINRPRPTIGSAIKSLSGAFDCSCTVRYGNWVGDLDIIYVSLKDRKKLLPLPPTIPQAELSTKVSAFYISPGIGYRVYASDANKISLDARTGFTYTTVSVDTQLTAGQFTDSAHFAPDFVQPWIGERLDFFPSRRWRLENTAAITGLGVDGGAVGWNAKIAASYLVNRWFMVTVGYLGQRTKRSISIRPDGSDRSVSLLLYGPEIALGVRF